MNNNIDVGLVGSYVVISRIQDTKSYYRRKSNFKSDLRLEGLKSTMNCIQLLKTSRKSSNEIKQLHRSFISFYFPRRILLIYYDKN